MNKLKLKWEIKSTIRDEVDIENIVDVMIDNGYLISHGLSDIIIKQEIKNYYEDYQNYDFKELPKEIQKIVFNAVTEEIKKRNKKITIEDIENKIHEFKSFIIKKLLSSTYDTLIDEKVQDLLDTIEKYKYQD